MAGSCSSTPPARPAPSRKCLWRGASVTYAATPTSPGSRASPRRSGRQHPTPQHRTSAMIRFESSHGAFTVELFEREAPLTVANFRQYVDDGFFDGTIFHRIVPGFVVQGGGMTADFSQKATRAPVRNEASDGLQNLRGTLSMARTD